MLQNWIPVWKNSIMKSRNMENHQIKMKNPRKTRSAPAVVYRGYYYEKNLCVMITHYNVFRRFFRTSYIVAITYE